MRLDELIRGLKYIALYLPWTELRKKAESILAQAVERLEAQQARIRELEAERNAMLEDLHIYDCDVCRYEGVRYYEAPCDSCKNAGGHADNWEWRGAKDTNVPSKEGENHG